MSSDPYSIFSYAAQASSYNIEIDILSYQIAYCSNAIYTHPVFVVIYKLGMKDVLNVIYCNMWSESLKEEIINNEVKPHGFSRLFGCKSMAFNHMA